MYFSGFLVLPIPSKLKRKVKLDGPWAGTIIYTTTAIPAFFRVQNNRRLALLRVGYIHVDLTGFYTIVATVADLRIKQYRLIRRRNIWNCKHFFLRHFILPKIHFLKK
jgi:hypothetical protein